MVVVVYWRNKTRYFDKLKQLWSDDGIMEEPGIFKYNGINELLNGRDDNDENGSILSVVG